MAIGTLVLQGIWEAVLKALSSVLGMGEAVLVTDRLNLPYR